MTSSSRAIKKELTQAFPGIKFSVKIHNSTVIVSWQLELGSHATVNEIKSVTEKYESTSSIQLSPAWTRNHEQWTIDCIKEEFKGHGLIHNPIFNRFQDEHGHSPFHVNIKYGRYLRNGVTSDLVDENGQEPYQKRLYYANLEKERQIKEVEIEEICSIR